jgi:hypothetical protein
MATSMTGCCNNLCCMCNTHLKVSFIKIVDILLSNTICCYRILNQAKPLINDFRIFAFYTLVVVFAGIFGYKIIMPLDKVANPVLSSSSGLISAEKVIDLLSYIQ